MFRKIQEALGEHEKEYPHHKEVNDMATEDLHSLGVIRPAKPFSVNVGHALDGHHRNVNGIRRNFDHKLQEEEKDAIDEEFTDLGELSAMIHDPEYIDDIVNHNPSENHKTARDVMNHYLDKHGRDSYRHLEQELLEPLFQNLQDRIREEGIIDHILAPKMVHETKHHPMNYAKLFKALLLDPVHEGHTKRNWEKNLPKILERRLQYG